MKKTKTNKGITLVELLVGMFAMGLILYGTSLVFSASFKSYRYVKGSQRAMEEGQYVIGYMAKTIRTSTIVNAAASSINVYDFSQGKCIRFELAGNVIRMGNANPGVVGSAASCNFGAIAMRNMTSNHVDRLRFNATSSSLGTVGKATMLLSLCADSGCSADQDRIGLQTSVSLRDYSEVD